MSLIPVSAGQINHEGHSAFDSVPHWQLALIAALLSCCLGTTFYPMVWTGGYFGDPDDAMRMVQIRDFMAGQSWYDMITYRLDPGHQHFIHWSRFVDVIMVFLIKMFGLFLSPEFAERAARLAYPAIMQFALFLAIARAAKSLIGPSTVIPTLFLCVLAGIGVAQFQPGRIDHHSLQIVLLANMMAYTLQALEPGNYRAASKAAAAAALSLGISIENIPFIAAMAAIWPIAWSLAGEQFRKQMFAYFCGLLLAVPAVFVLTIGYSRWLISGCDGLSLSYLLPTAAGACGCCLLTLRETTASPHKRFILVIVTGCIAITTMALHSPNCFGNPFSNVDTFLWRYWLDHVHEARPLYSSFLHSKSYTILVAGPAFLCGILAFIAAVKERGTKRVPWIIASVFIIAGIAATIWQIRAVSSLQPLATLGGAWAIVQFRHYLERSGLSTAHILALALALPLSTTGWEMTFNFLPKAKAGPVQQADGVATPADDLNGCRNASSYALLAKLPAGLVLNPIDIGAHVLVYTHHSSLAAGYHRNNRGNRTAAEALIASASNAEDIVRKNKVNYIVLCPQHAELEYVREFGPKGLGGELAVGTTSEWLERLSGAKDPVQVYRVRDL